MVRQLEYRIVGISHDDLADGSARPGLTFEATNDALGAQRMNATDANAGGWEKSELRGRLNTGDLWSLLPGELQSKAKAVTKMTDNKGGGTAGIPLGHDRPRSSCSRRPKSMAIIAPRASSTSTTNPRV